MSTGPATPVKKRLLHKYIYYSQALPGSLDSGYGFIARVVLGWNVVSSGLVTAGGQIVLALGLAAETIFRSHEPRWRGPGAGGK